MKQIGVVIPVFNGEKTIEKSIKSLLNQTYKDWIAIIINDGSRDNTKSILKKYEDIERFYVVHFKHNMGRPVARQKGLEVVRSLGLKYMCMLDADDWYYPEKLFLQYEIMENNLNLSLLSSGIIITNKNYEAEIIQLLENDSNDDLIFLDCINFKDYLPVPHASSILRVSSLTGKKYDKRLSLGQDQDFMISVLIGRKYAMLNKPLYVYNLGESMTFKKYYRGQLSTLIVQGKYLNKFSLSYLRRVIIVCFKIIAGFFLFFFKFSKILISLRGVKLNKEEILKFEKNQSTII